MRERGPREPGKVERVRRAGISSVQTPLAGLPQYWTLNQPAAVAFRFSFEAYLLKRLHEVLLRHQRPSELLDVPWSIDMSFCRCQFR